jgi:hypothetical protein
MSPTLCGSVIPSQSRHTREPPEIECLDQLSESESMICGSESEFNAPTGLYLDHNFPSTKGY